MTKDKALAIIGILMGFMAMGLSFSLINANLQSIQAELGASILQLQWIINVYGIFIASTLVAMGRLGDIYGRKRLFLIGMGLFAIAMLGGGLANSPEIIIAFQVVWGLAGAILLPISQALLINIFPDEKKSIATGIWNSSSGVSLAIGPLIGGMILKFLSWRWVFLINLPVVAVGFILTLLFVRESKTEGESTKVDWAGSLTLMIAIATFVLATAQRNKWGIFIVLSFYLLSGGALLLLHFVEKKAEVPIIRKDLFKNRGFLLCCLSGFCMIGIFWSGIFLLPLYVQKQLQYTPFQAGIMLLGFALPIALLAPLSAHLYNKIAPNKLIGLGFFLLTASCIMQLQFGEVSSSRFIAVAILLLGIGFSLIMTPIMTEALSTISRNFAGIASGTFVTMQEIGGSVGLALTVSIVRKQEDFSIGFHNGMWIVLAFSLVGIFSSFFMQQERPSITTNDEPEESL